LAGMAGQETCAARDDFLLREKASWVVRETTTTIPEF